MSITFFVSGEAPQEKAYCKDVYPGLDEEYYEDDPYVQKDDSGQHFVMRSTWPELNVSNANASIVFTLMGIGAEADYCGEIVQSRLAVISRNVIKNLNTVKRVGAHVRPTIIDGRFIDGGVTYEQVERYCTTILSVIKCAQENNTGINWG